jgi:hypothetical protein
LAKRKKEKKIYKYDCSLTGETYKLTAQAQNPEELVSVKSWYEMHPEKDDRPEDIKKRLGLTAEAKAEAEAAQ